MSTPEMNFAELANAPHDPQRDNRRGIATIGDLLLVGAASKAWARRHPGLHEMGRIVEAYASAIPPLFTFFSTPDTKLGGITFSLTAAFGIANLVKTLRAEGFAKDLNKPDPAEVANELDRRANRLAAKGKLDKALGLYTLATATREGRDTSSGAPAVGIPSTSVAPQ